MDGQFLKDGRSPDRPILAQSTPAKQAWGSGQTNPNPRISSTLPRQNFITDETKIDRFQANESAIEEEPSSGLVSFFISYGLYEKSTISFYDFHPILRNHGWVIPF